MLNGSKSTRLWDCSWIFNKRVHHNWTVCDGKVFSKHVCIYIEHSFLKLSSIVPRENLFVILRILNSSIDDDAYNTIYFSFFAIGGSARNEREKISLDLRSISSASPGTIYVACEESRRIDTALSLSTDEGRTMFLGKQIIKWESGWTSLDCYSKKFPLRKYHFWGEQ